MSMITLNGQLVNIFKVPKGVTPDGTEYGGNDKIQVLAKVELPDAEYRVEMLTLSAPDITPFRDHVGKNISIPVGAFVSGKAIQWFIPKTANLAHLSPSKA